MAEEKTDSRKYRAEYPPADAQEILCGRESADRAGRVAGRRNDLGDVP